MPRYIDADKVMEEINRIGGHNLCEWETLGVKALIDRQPTADVAPKSEVEEIIYKLECLLCHATGSKLSKYTYDLRTMEMVVTDYINESYDEIIDRTLCLDINAYSAYEELKKKYTEGGAKDE